MIGNRVHAYLKLGNLGISLSDHVGTNRFSLVGQA